MKINCDGLLVRGHVSQVGYLSLNSPEFFFAYKYPLHDSLTLPQTTILTLTLVLEIKQKNSDELTDKYNDNGIIIPPPTVVAGSILFYC